jgi:hypothetical protein
MDSTVQRALLRATAQANMTGIRCCELDHQQIRSYRRLLPKRCLKLHWDYGNVVSEKNRQALRHRVNATDGCRVLPRACAMRPYAGRVCKPGIHDVDTREHGQSNKNTLTTLERRGRRHHTHLMVGKECVGKKGVG